jgi:hypothetical protein
VTVGTGQEEEFPPIEPTDSPEKIPSRVVLCLSRFAFNSILQLQSPPSRLKLTRRGICFNPPLSLLEESASWGWPGESPTEKPGTHGAVPRRQRIDSRASCHRRAAVPLNSYGWVIRFPSPFSSLIQPCTQGRAGPYPNLSHFYFSKLFEFYQIKLGFPGTVPIDKFTHHD